MNHSDLLPYQKDMIRRITITANSAVFAGMASAPNIQNIKCPSCNEVMRFIPGTYGFFYGCPKFLDVDPRKRCADSIPAERDGTPFSLERRDAVRKARHAAHGLFDRLWNPDGGKRLMTRSAAYKWLRKQLRIPRETCHIGMFEVEQCEQVVKVCKELLERSHSGAFVPKGIKAQHTGRGYKGRPYRYE